MPEDKSLPYLDKKLPIDERVWDLLGRMTLEEKLAQLSAAWLSEVSNENGFSAEAAGKRIGLGIGQITRPGGGSPFTPGEVALAVNEIQAFLTQETRLGIPAIVHEECCSGFMARGATTFPQSIGLASTWEPELAKAMTNVIRAQMRAVGAHQGLAPLFDVTRDPRWGRVEETFGEDPYLVASMGIAYVRGLQSVDLSQGVAATGKHYGAHGMAEGGLNWAPVHLGKRELREVYLFPFEAAVKDAELATIMNAYHELDGVPCASSRELLTTILRDEWGFKGVVVSDYNAIVMLADYHNVAADKAEAACLALQAGLNLELPGTDCYGKPLLESVRAGKLDISVVNESVRRILALKFHLGLFENPFVDPGKAPEAYSRPEQTELARTIAQKTMVLLKNEGNLLPLNPELGSIAVIGPNTDVPRHMLGDYSYASVVDLMEGGGIPEDAYPPQNTRYPDRMPPMLSVLDAVRKRVSQKTVVRYSRGCRITDPSKEGFVEAVQIARESEVAVLVMGGKSGLTADSTCGELRDRATLGLPGVQEDLVKAILETGTPVVLVIIDGRPVALPGLVDLLPAILEAWLPGQEGGPAVADVLFGDFNPGGKLPISFPRSAGQVPVYYGHKPSGGRSFMFEDYVDLGCTPLFPFGHGLSYTQFEYSDLRLSPAQVNPGGELTVQLTVKNIGDRPGDEVVQLYTHDEISSLTRPVKELKGFKRVTLQPGEARTMAFILSTAQLAFYNLEMEYILEPGTFEVLIGSSSEDIQLKGRFEVVGETIPVSKKVFFSQNK